MYVHIGNNYILNSNNIIGIFNIEELKKDNSFEKLENYLAPKENILDISNGKQKSFILVKEEKIKAYISNISSFTIANRIK